MLTMWEAAARAFDDTPVWPTPGALARTLNRTIVQTPALDLIDAALVDVMARPNGRLIISMPPQEGKSQRVSRAFPLWALAQNHDLRIAITSYEHGVARRWGRTIRDDIVNHPGTLNLSIRDDLSAQHEWQLKGQHPDGTEYLGGVYSTGIGGALTGRPVDLLIIDDPVKDRKQADSDTYRQRGIDWWTDVASTRLSPGAAVVMVLTRWHHGDLAGHLIADAEGDDWVVLNIPAEAVSKDDPLGRKPGAFMESARKRTTRDWINIRKRVGPRTWASLYQGSPSPDTGNLFPASKWARYDRPMWVERTDGSRWVPEIQSGNGELIQSWDFTFKDSKGSDYVVGQVWLRIGMNAYLLDQVRRRAAFVDSVQMIKDMTAKWPQAIAKLVEDKANGPAILNSLRSQIIGMVPVEPEGSKYARAEAITPLAASHNIWLPDPAKVPGTSWVVTLTEEAQDFPSATHDDTVDAMTQAVHRLLLVPILADFDPEELMDDDDDSLGWEAG